MLKIKGRSGFAMAATLPSMTLNPPLSRKSSSRLLVPVTPRAAHFPPSISYSPIKPVVHPLARRNDGTKQKGFCVQRGQPLLVGPRCAIHVPSDWGGEEVDEGDALEEEAAHSHMHAKDTVINLYKFINAKKVDNIRGVIDENCYFEDLSFPKPFQGRQEVMHFFDELAGGMGEHMAFEIEKVMEGDDKSTACLMWHIEWKNKPIPFTKGCSFYECSSNKGGELLIKKARVVIESPIKPGVFVLKLLRVVSSIFDRFPNLTENFLLKPHIVLKILAKIYTLFIEPMILPVLVYYMHLWTFATRLIGYLVKIMVMITKFFK